MNIVYTAILSVRIWWIDMRRCFDDLYIRSGQDAFDNAIRLGLKHPDQWMYMYSDGPFDFFKHYRTRVYVCYRYKGLIWHIEMLLAKLIY